MAYERPGPLTPAFVLKMLDSSKNYADIQKQLREGRVLPWDLEATFLVNNTERIKKVVLDPVTCHMTDDTVLKGTKTTKDDEIKLITAHSTLDWVMNNGSAEESMVDVGPVINYPGHRYRPTSTNPPFDPNLATVPCANCGECGHLFKDCTLACSQCWVSIQGGLP
ncbi:hypothetical protein VMCG_08401 [Cytospora schulzeri]|uniref:CCHC-type domain-containing protein n=1 Tax=Cytospora schulzeri TaxID=448051 RepID=A0A423VQM8_9PEZI|nr:hypothetical protein VMCG_08401 [Valsa malicola]